MGQAHFGLVLTPCLPLPPQLTSVKQMLGGMYMATLPRQDTWAPSVTANTILPGVIRLFSTHLSQKPVYLPARGGNDQLTQSPQMPVSDCEVTPKKAELPDDMDQYKDYPKTCSIPTCYQPLLLPPAPSTLRWLAKQRQDQGGAAQSPTAETLWWGDWSTAASTLLCVELPLLQWGRRLAAFNKFVLGAPNFLNENLWVLVFAKSWTFLHLQAIYPFSSNLNVRPWWVSRCQDTTWANLSMSA